MPNFGFGPTGARASTTRPAAGSDPYNVQTWFKNASAPGKADGSVIPAEWLNVLIAERLNLAYVAGISISSNAPADTFLVTAISKLVANRVQIEAAGSALVQRIDDQLGTGWRTAINGDQVIDLIDGKIGVDWRSFNPDAYWRKDQDIVSPNLVGTPTAPTAAPGTNTTQLATTAFVTAMGSGYAPLASPAFTGVPTAPTAAPGTNTTQIATMAAVQAAIAALIASAPGALDTLDELAAAFGDDANFAATMTTALAGKQPLDATLTAFAGLTIAADKLPYGSGSDGFSTTDFTAFARTLLDDANQGAMQTTLGLVPGTNVQAYHARLADLAGISWVQGDIAYFNGTALVRLAPGTSGHFLKTQGAGANPVWDAASGGGGYSGGDLSSAAGIVSGTEGAPGLYFVGDTDTGLHRPAADVLGFVTAANMRWKIDASGHLLAEDTNTYDIGSSGGNKPRSIYAAGTVYAANHVQVTNAYLWANGTNFQAPSDGVISLYNNGNTSFGRMQFGGTTTSFPALKRSSATLQARLADDSAFAEFKASILEAGTSVKFADATTQTTAAVQDVRLGTETNDTSLNQNTDYKGAAGKIMTGIKTMLSSELGVQTIYWKPIQKNVGGSWTTITG